MMFEEVMIQTGARRNLCTNAKSSYATIGVFHIHPNITHGAARDDFQNGIMPPVTMYQRDAITGDANKSANKIAVGLPS